MTILLIGIIYLIGVFAAIAFMCYVFNFEEETEDDENVELIFSVFSWIWMFSMLVSVVSYLLWNYAIRYPFEGFYNWCNKKFRKI